MDDKDKSGHEKMTPPVPPKTVADDPFSAPPPGDLLKKNGGEATKLPDKKEEKKPSPPARPSMPTAQEVQKKLEERQKLLQMEKEREAAQAAKRKDPAPPAKKTESGWKGDPFAAPPPGESFDKDMEEKSLAVPTNDLSQTPVENRKEDKVAGGLNHLPDVEDPFTQPLPQDDKKQREEREKAKKAAMEAAAARNVTQTEDGMGQKKAPLRIGEKLINLGLISQDQLQVALTEQRTSKKLLGAILVDLGFLTESALGEVLAKSTGTEKFDPKASMLDTELVRKIPKELAVRHKVIPVSFTDDTVYLAMADVYNVLAIDQVRRHFPRTVNLVPTFCTESEILELVDQYYDYETEIDGILQEIETGIRDHAQLDGQQEGYINPTVRLVNALLMDAIKAGASDIHLEPEGSFLRLRYRVDGQLIQARTFHREYWSAMAVRLKIMSGMNIAEARIPQDGRISFTVQGREVDFRVATQPTIHGENIVMRLLDKAKALVPLDHLGYSEHNISLLKRLIKRPEGILIVTGPTGSGKTTTLYSLLNYINEIDVNIMTLEDPVEYMIPLIRQTNVREGSIDFANGIRSLMRQDPDVIFIGEIRDEDTAQMGLRAALTGHQVFTSLHTNDALGAIPRLIDIGVPPYLLAGSLIGSVAQRLARKLCPSCKKGRKATEEECALLGAKPGEAPEVYEPVGCKNCYGKGYKGRIAIAEVLRIDNEMDELIAAGAVRRQMMEHALNKGFVPMLDDGVSKVKQGMIDIQELISTVDMTERMN